MKSIRVLAPDFGDPESAPPSMELDTRMTFTVQPRTDPKDLRR